MLKPVPRVTNKSNSKFLNEEQIMKVKTDVKAGAEGGE